MNTGRKFDGVLELVAKVILAVWTFIFREYDEFEIVVKIKRVVTQGTTPFKECMACVWVCVCVWRRKGYMK